MRTRSDSYAGGDSAVRDVYRHRYGTLKVLNASANCALAFGIAAEQLLAQSLTSYLSDDDVKLLRQHLLQPALQEAAPLSLCIGTPGTAPNAGPYTQTQQAIAASWSLNMMPIPQL
jgi:hypothetical protein